MTKGQKVSTVNLDLIWPLMRDREHDKDDFALLRNGSYTVRICLFRATCSFGFDENDYPGDAAFAVLRKSFQYTSYWLNNPPGLSFIKQHGFGFLVLFNGRLHSDLQGKDAAALGGRDGDAAVDSAIREGFPRNVRIYLDQEEGGRLLPDQ